MKLQEKKIYGLSIKEVLEKLLSFEGQTLIFFDTETLGLKPQNFDTQLTEVAGIAFDGTTFEQIGIFHEKASLRKDAQATMKVQDTEPPKKGSMKMRDIMKMTKYGERHTKFKDEQQVVQEFNDWLGTFNNPLLIAHNASFDMKYISQRGQHYGIRMNRFRVLDSLKIAQLYFVPALQSLEKSGDESVKKMLGALTRSGRINSNLGQLSNALEVNVDNWHSAIADVQSLVGVLKGIVEFLKGHQDVDIRKFHTKAVVKDIGKRKKQ